MKGLFKIGVCIPAVMAITGYAIILYTKFVTLGIAMLVLAGVLGTAQLLLLVGLTPSAIDLLLAKLYKHFFILEFNDTRVIKKYLGKYKSGFVWLDEEQAIGYIISSNNTVHFLDGVPVVVVYGTNGIACDIKALAQLQNLSELGIDRETLLEVIKENKVSELIDYQKEVMKYV